MKTEIKLCSENGLYAVAKLADEIWHECYSNLLSPQQIDYMVAQFQSVKAMQHQCAEQNYAYYGIFVKDRLKGYFAIQLQEEALFLSKLYLHSSLRGQKVTTKIMEKVRQVAFDNGYTKIILTVNKHNRQAIETYKHLGFEIIDEMVTDIGEGYVMDDYLMQAMV